jgi:hypothetical protein
MTLAKKYAVLQMKHFYMTPERCGVLSEYHLGADLGEYVTWYKTF